MYIKRKSQVDKDTWGDKALERQKYDKVGVTDNMEIREEVS